MFLGYIGDGLDVILSTKVQNERNNHSTHLGKWLATGVGDIISVKFLNVLTDYINTITRDSGT